MPDPYRAHGVALALVDQVWMPTITELIEKLKVLTTDFTCIRWIADQKGIKNTGKRGLRLSSADSGHSEADSQPDYLGRTLVYDRSGPPLRNGGKPSRRVCPGEEMEAERKANTSRLGVGFGGWGYTSR